MILLGGSSCRDDQATRRPGMSVCSSVSAPYLRYPLVVGGKHARVCRIQRGAHWYPSCPRRGTGRTSVLLRPTRLKRMALRNLMCARFSHTLGFAVKHIQASCYVQESCGEQEVAIEVK
eukprot:853526-Pelagomonas_calceolata.AAC.3